VTSPGGVTRYEQVRERLGLVSLHLVRPLLVAVLVVLVVAAACTRAGETAPPGAQRADASESVRNLTSIETLQEQFNDDAGRARLILLISPT
jgi:hypothetical protein